jgi:predicted RNase H-like nuclease (RuvC/YqgF family)
VSEEATGPVEGTSRTLKPAGGGKAGDPAVRYRNIPDLIRQFEERIARFQKENEQLDQVRVSFERAPDYRLSTSEIEYRGRRVMLLMREKYANQRLISDLEQRIRDLKHEREQLRRDYNLE